MKAFFKDAEGIDTSAGGNPPSIRQSARHDGRPVQPEPRQILAQSVGVVDLLLFLARNGEQLAAGVRQAVGVAADLDHGVELAAVEDIELDGAQGEGGGQVRATVTPSQPRPLALTDRGALRGLRATALMAGVPVSVAQRELETLRHRLPGVDGSVRELPQREDPGNALIVEVEHGGLVEIFTGFGHKGHPAEQVAIDMAREVSVYLASGGAAGEHLADQLVLLLALAGGGGFSTHVRSSHLQTNIEGVEKFHPMAFTTRDEKGVATVCVE